MKKQNGAMKKWVSLAVSLVLMASTFTACGGTASTPASERSPMHAEAEKSESPAKRYESMPATDVNAEPGAAGTVAVAPQANADNESYKKIEENGYKSSLKDPLSTFSIDVDTASYSNLRRFIEDGQRPPEDAVRIEEMINYFKYDYTQPDGEKPFSVTTEMAQCPWNKEHNLALIGIQGKNISSETIPPSNIVFLIDTSGSMEDSNKLPLLKSAFGMLVSQLRAEDRVAIVTYAGSAGVVLQPTSGKEKTKILNAIENLEAGGSTAGAAGINLAYNLASENYSKNGNNRVILATDGDFNVGVSSDGELTRIIEKKRDEGIFLSVLGFGTGNYKDSKMEAIADKGNGNYAYIDKLSEAQKVLVGQMAGTLYTIAKDVKIQIEFNPAKIKGYRLIGYENRLLNKEDFNNDKVDAGEIGAGHTVTALYELIPADSNEKVGSVDPLKYQKETDTKANTTVNTNDVSGEYMNVKIRYKAPKSDNSQLLEYPVTERSFNTEQSGNLTFAAAVAEFGMLLRNSDNRGNASISHVLSAAKASRGADLDGYRAEFIQLVERASRFFR